MEKSFAEHQKTVKTAKLFSLETFMVYSIIIYIDFYVTICRLCCNAGMRLNLRIYVIYCKENVIVQGIHFTNINL